MAEEGSREEKPWFECHIFVCVNHRPEGDPRGSCGAKGSEALRDYMKSRVKALGLRRTRVNASLCLDRCELGPCVVAYPSGDWFRIRNQDEAEAALRTITRSDEGDGLALRLPGRKG